MSNNVQNLGDTPNSKTNNILFDSTSWYRSLKSVSLLYQWQLIQSNEDIVRLLRLHQDWFNQPHYQVNDSLLDQLIKDWPLVDRRGRIWACFHIGSYGLIARVLMTLGHKLAILLRADVFEAQSQLYRQQYKLFFGREATATDLIFIKADVGNPLLKLREAIRNSYQVIFFIDGQLEAAKVSKGWASVKLFGADLFLREGIVALGYWTGAPITTAIMSRPDKQITIRLAGDRYVKSKTEYQAIMQYILSRVEDLKPEELLQWESLPAIFEKTSVMSADVSLLQPMWLPLVVMHKTMLFDLSTGRSVEIGPNDFDKACQQFRAI